MMLRSGPRTSRAMLLCCLFGASALLTGATGAQQTPSAKASPRDMVDALHTAFGEHHARAVHTKGVMLEGTFSPDVDARKLTKAPIFTGGAVPVVARFSLFAGVPTLPDTNDGASPAGFGVKIKGRDGDDFDIEANQHKDFITATSEEFRTFLNAVGAAGKGDKAPLDAFLASHPHAREFLGSRSYPTSYARAKYFGVNSVKFTNAKGQVAFVRYQFVPHSGEEYLSADQRMAQSENYLQQEIVGRVATQAVVFDWYAQIAESGDKIEDPSIAWPDTRRLVKLGIFTLTRLPADPETAQRTLLFLPGKEHPGVAPADPMLVLRNVAYPISFHERQ